MFFFCIINNSKSPKKDTFLDAQTKDHNVSYPGIEILSILSFLWKEHESALIFMQIHSVELLISGNIWE